MVRPPGTIDAFIEYENKRRMKGGVIDEEAGKNIGKALYSSSFC
jgi:hypothetical protein